MRKQATQEPSLADKIRRLPPEKVAEVKAPASTLPTDMGARSEGPVPETL